MPINLLPEELRRKETKPEKEKKEEIKIRKPPREKPLARKKALFGFLRKPLARPEEPGEPVPPEQPLEVSPGEVPEAKAPEARPEVRKEPLPPPEEPGLAPAEEKVPELAELLARQKEPKPTEVGLLKKHKKLKPEPGPSGPEISLMPTREMIIPRVVRGRFIMFIAALIVILTVFTITWLYVRWHFEKMASEVEDYSHQLLTVEAQTRPFLELRDEIAKLERKSSKVKELLANHIYWTKFFSLLEAHTIDNVFFGDFSADTSGVIHLNGIGKDLISVARQLVAFQNASDFVKDVKMSNISLNPKGISFSVDLRLIEGVFTK